MSEKTPSSNSFFLFSFLPAILYWYLEANYPVKIALIGGILLSILEIGLEKILFKHVHQLSKMNFFLIVFLGGFSLLEEDGIWFKLQPTISMWAVAVYFVYKRKNGKGGFMQELMKDMNKNAQLPPDEIFQSMEKNLVYVFIVYGLLMGALAFWAPTKYWAFGKGVGLFVVIFIFLIIQMLINKRIIKKLRQN